MSAFLSFRTLILVRVSAVAETGAMIALLYLTLIHLACASPHINRHPAAAPDRFRVKSLPDSPSLPSNWAGQIPIPGTEDGNALFFWLFETEDKAYDDNLISMCNPTQG